MRTIRPKKLQRLMLIATLVSMTTFVLHNISIQTDELQEHEPIGTLPAKRRVQSGQAYLIDQPGCSIPKFDQWSPEVARFYQAISGEYECPGPTPLIRVVNYTTLKVDRQVLRNYYKTEIDACMYGEVVREDSKNNNPDFNIVLKKLKQPTMFQDSIEAQSDFVYVECSNNAGKIFYRDFHALLPAKARVEKRCRTKAKLYKTNSRKLSVMILGLDSVSKLNFVRHQRKTSTLLKALNAIELHGYNKVGENTLVNVIPLLTGNFIKRYNDENYFDEFNFIWKDFRKRGYRTLYGEDGVKDATFNYRSYGFYDSPTDYYYRAMSMVLEDSFINDRSREACVDNKLLLTSLLDWLRDYATRFKEGLAHSFIWSNSMTHDYLNYAGYADTPVHNFIKELQEGGVLENTVLFFISDHGMRWGDIVNTRTGKYEERMPFAYLVFPPWFRKAHPHIWKNLKQNQHKLTTPFDLYQTQRSIMTVGDEGPKKSAGFGISLFDSIPGNRTCYDARIPVHHCACINYQRISTGDARAVKAVKSVVYSLNELLHPFKDRCSFLLLGRILEAHVNDEKGPAELTFRVVFVVQPSGGKFEATVKYKDGAFIASNEFSRINKYGDQSFCVKDHFALKPVCYCRHQQ